MLKRIKAWMDDNIPASPPFLLALAVACALIVLGDAEPITVLTLTATCLYYAFR